MQPHARHAGSDSSSSGTGKPLPSVPPIDTVSPRSPESPINYSPSIKRKPLPLSAVSPPPIPIFSGLPLPQDQDRATAPPSSNALNDVLDTAPQEAVEFFTPFEHDPRAHYFSGPVDTPNRVSINDFPVPPITHSQTPIVADEGEAVGSKGKGMGLRLGERPAPLRMESINSAKSLDTKKPQTPGSKFTSFFMRKPQPSPGADSAVTEISEGRSPAPSPYPQSDTGSGRGSGAYFNLTSGRTNKFGSQDSIEYSQSTRGSADIRCNALEAELKEISIELANSIRRELDLEDIIEKLQSENPPIYSADRTSDYFSDSGASSLRADGSEITAKEELDKVKRDAEQQRAQLRVDLSQRWQNETSQRKTLETAFDDLRRKLHEERKAKENIEDLTNALRGELEQIRSQSQGELVKLQQEVQHLRDENAALVSAREMERNINRGSMHFIAEENDADPASRGTTPLPRIGSLSRSNTITSVRNNRGSLARSGSLTRATSTANRPGPAIESIDHAVEKIKSVEQQRDALHNTVKYLLKRQEIQQKQVTKRTRMLETELERAQNSSPQPRKRGYEREVRVLRAEINTLRKRADDALDQKWQCEKNLAGLKMDLDRNKQETASLQKILQARGSDPDVQGLMSTTLENAIIEMQKERARIQESSAQIRQEEELSEQLEEYATRSEALSTQVKKQLQNNAALRARLKHAVESGESNQHASAEQIIELQAKLRRLEDLIASAQVQSETAVMKHEEEVRILKASQNAQLMRAHSADKKLNPNLLTPTVRSPLSPMFANSKRSPKLDMTSSGPGMALHEALRTEYLENKVTELEKALADTESEIGKIVGKMSQAQISVAELEAERDEALRLTRQLEGQVYEERTRYAHLIETVNQW
ncbi:hypothetical protein LTS08_006469 [Lithohypha guttulata]|nr:hypothetical protein LTS08_006469 [Lithohypha guttulata]